MPDFVETPDFLNRSTALYRRRSFERQYFNPTDPMHLQSLKVFIETGNWGDTQFYREDPFSDVPMTVLMKLAGHTLGACRETYAQRTLRIAQRLKTTLAAAHPTV